MRARAEPAAVDTRSRVDMTGADRRRGDRGAGVVRALDALALLLLLIYAVPFFWQVLTSFKPDAFLVRLPPVFPSRLTIAHYDAVIRQSLIPRALLNSLAVASFTTVAAVLLGLGAAYALARLPVPAKRLILLGIVAGTAFPQIAIVSPLYLALRAFGLRDTWGGLILADVSFALPLVIWLLTGFIRDIPLDLDEAASLDGAGRLATLRFILLPLVAPGLASAALLTFLASWNEFLFAYTFTAGESSRTVPVALALFPGVFEVPWGDIAAASILASLPPIVIVIALQRFLVRGLLAGALRE
jgi:multiple sugar transport system permease protein